jgi:hypothetical protein
VLNGTLSALWEKKKTHHKNPVSAFFQCYLDYCVVSLVSPEDAPPYTEELVRLGKMRWRIRAPEESAEVVLPRFFSHPDTNRFRPKRSVSHYYENHKVSSILTHAIRHLPCLSFLEDRLRIFSPYAGSILVSNRNASAANHMSLYIDFISDAQPAA